MSGLPKDWAIDRLKDVSVINASSLPASTDPELEFPYLEISNVDYFGIVDLAAIERLRFEDAPSRARRLVFKNSTIISSVRPNLQAVVFSPMSHAGWSAQLGSMSCNQMSTNYIQNFASTFLYRTTHGNILRRRQRESAILLSVRENSGVLSCRFQN